METVKQSAKLVYAESPAKPVAGFIAKFDPKHGVLPLWQGCGPGDSKFPELVGRRFDFGRVVLRGQVGAHFGSGGGGGFAGQTEDLAVAGERLGLIRKTT